MTWQERRKYTTGYKKYICWYFLDGKPTETHITSTSMDEAKREIMRIEEGKVKKLVIKFKI